MLQKEALPSHCNSQAKKSNLSLSFLPNKQSFYLRKRMFGCRRVLQIATTSFLKGGPLGMNISTSLKEEHKLLPSKNPLKTNWGVASSETGSVRLFGKGAFGLYMLKYLVGSRVLYYKCIQHY